MDLFLDFIQIFRRIMIILAQNKVCFIFILHCLLNKNVVPEKNVHVHVSWFVKLLDFSSCLKKSLKSS